MTKNKSNLTVSVTHEVKKAIDFICRTKKLTLTEWLTEAIASKLQKELE